MRGSGLAKQLWFWVIVAIALGIFVGVVFPETAAKSKWLAEAFIQLAAEPHFKTRNPTD